MGDLFLPFLAGMGGKGVIERFAIDVLRMCRQVAADGSREIGIRAIGYDARSLRQRGRSNSSAEWPNCESASSR